MREALDMCAVILAAGYSSRMGVFKPLLEIDGQPAVARIARAAAEAGMRRVIVVTGHKHEEMERTLRSSDPAVETVYNERYAEGMFTSVQAGIRAALQSCGSGDVRSARQSDESDGVRSGAPGRGPDGILLFPADVPLVPPQVIGALIDAWAAASPSFFAVPCYRGKKGHPLLIPVSYADEILAHDGSGGLKAITDRYDHRLIRLETEEEAVVLDMDTREEYGEILRHHRYMGAKAEDRAREYRECAETRARESVETCARKGVETCVRKGVETCVRESVETCARESVETCAREDGSCGEGFCGRLILIRHGSAEPHREKIFLGQTDVPLSDRGREEAREAARRLAGFKIQTDRIYASDLSRTEETAQIIAATLQGGIAAPQIPGLRVVTVPQFREMHLGDWDGRYISEIRRRCPDEYEERGKNILRYKRGAEAENYYDLRYRVIKELRRVLIEERRRGVTDVILVTHAGVIRVIEAELRGIPLEETLRADIPRGSIHVTEWNGRSAIFHQ
jgi:broad specificity phosphatase PhoE/CTP:molybdopterin cytidylyltransferase MocA